MQFASCNSRCIFPQTKILHTVVRSSTGRLESANYRASRRAWLWTSALIIRKNGKNRYRTWYDMVTQLISVDLLEERDRGERKFVDRYEGDTGKQRIILSCSGRASKWTRGNSSLDTKGIFYWSLANCHGYDGPSVPARTYGSNVWL